MRLVARLFRSDLAMTRSVSVSKGAVLAVGMRWTDRLIGLVSTVILARLLVPQDFGIIAMGSLVIGLIDALLDMGVNVALIQNQNATQEDYNAAWTLRLIQSAVAASLVLAAAEPAAAYFRDPRVASVIQLLSLALILSGIENIGIVSFQKKREFGVEFRFLFLKRISAFVITIVAAWFLRSYWALVIGTLSARVVGVCLSYGMHSMRPRLSFARMKPMLSFSSWNLLRGMAGFLNENLHRIVVGGRESTAVMGMYSLGSDIAALPSTELLAPLSRVLFPTFVALRHDPAKLKRAFLVALGIQALVGIAAGTGLVLVADEAVRVLLGAKWIAAVPFVQIIGVVNVIIAIGISGGYLLLALGRAKVTALTGSLSVLVFGVLAMVIFPAADAAAIAALRLAVAAFGVLLFMYLVKRELRSLRVRELLASIWRPCAAAAIMVAGVLALPSLAAMPAVAQLLVKVALGATIYLTSLLVVWRLAGCPDGAESYLLEKSKLDRAVRRVLGQRPERE